MNTTVDASTDTQALIGSTYSTEHFGPFRVLGASQAPEISAIAYMAKGEDGLTFFAFLPWGKQLIS